MDCTNCDGTGQVKTDTYQGHCFLCRGLGSLCDACGEAAEEGLCDCEKDTCIEDMSDGSDRSDESD